MVGTLSSLSAIWRPDRSPDITKLTELEFGDVGFSPDGKLMLGATYDGRWELRTGEGDLMSSGSHDTGISGSLSTLAISPTGSQFATANSAGKVVLWDVKTGKPIGQPWEVGRDAVRRLAFSPEGRWLAAAGGFLDRKGVHVWDFAAGKLLFENDLPEPGTNVSFSPSGRYLLSTNVKYDAREGEAQIWDTTSGLPAGPKLSSVYQAEWGADSRTLVTVGSDQTIKVWDPFSAGAAMLSVEQQEQLRTGKFSRDRALIAAVSSNELRVFGIEDFDHVDYSSRADERSEWDRNNFTFNDDASILVHTGEHESSALDLKNEQALPTFVHKDANGWVSIDYVSSHEFSSDGTTVLLAGGGASVDKEGTVLVWNAVSGKALFEPLIHKDYVEAASFSPDGRLILSASRDGTAGLWDIPSGRLVHRLDHGASVNHAAFDGNGRLVVTAAGDAAARVWDVASGKLIEPAMRHENAVRYAIFSPDKSSILTIALARDGETSVMRLWDAATHEPISATVSLGVRAVAKAAFSPDGQLIVVPDGPDGARIWSTATMEPISPHLDDLPQSVMGMPSPTFLVRQRSLLVSKDSRNAPLPVGISQPSDGGHRVRPWSLPSDSREPAQIIAAGEAMASRHIDSTGALVALPPEALRARWAESLDGGVLPQKPGTEERVAWHRRESEECELTRLWFCTVWHISQIAMLQLSAMDAQLHLSRGRALAELKRWSEAEDDYNKAREFRGSDMETVPLLFLLRAVNGNTTEYQGLFERLLELARQAPDADKRAQILSAALVGPKPLSERDRKSILDLAEADLRATQAGDWSETRHVLAALAYRSGDLTGAITQLEAIRNENRLGKNSTLLFAMARLRTGDRGDAESLYSLAKTELVQYESYRLQGDNWAAGLTFDEWVQVSILHAEADRIFAETN